MATYIHIYVMLRVMLTQLRPFHDDIFQALSEDLTRLLAGSVQWEAMARMYQVILVMYQGAHVICHVMLLFLLTPFLLPHPGPPVGHSLLLFQDIC